MLSTSPASCESEANVVFSSSAKEKRRRGDRIGHIGNEFGSLDWKDKVGIGESIVRDSDSALACHCFFYCRQIASLVKKH